MLYFPASTGWQLANVTIGAMKFSVTLLVSCLSLSLTRPATAQNTQLDPTFQPPQILAGAGSGTVYDVVQQADGKYVIGGAFNTINGVRARNLARLNADGSLDVAFTAACQANGAVYSLALQPNGQVLAAGAFDSLAGASRRSVGRLLPAGTLDAGFNAGLTSSYASEQVGLLPGGDVLMLVPQSGSATTLDGLRRLNGQTGLPDPTFQQAVSALCFAVQSDGKIVTGGGNASYVLMHLLARLLPTGSLDPGFTPLTTYFTSTTAQLEVDANDNIYRLGTWNSNVGRGLSGPGIGQNDWGTLQAQVFRRQPNGRFLVAGSPATLGSPLTTRLLPTGQQDASYQATNGPRSVLAGDRVLRFLVQPNGALMLAGSFTQAGTTPVHGLVRMLDASVLAKATAQNEIGTVVWPVPSTTEVYVALAAQAQQVQLLDAVGRVVLSQPAAAGGKSLTLNIAALPMGVYALRVQYAQGGTVVRRVVRQ
jgi:uncharacterized delta-60 repeat protein